jgi:tetratricopeptide (TPR) repeat protein
MHGSAWSTKRLGAAMLATPLLALATSIVGATAGQAGTSGSGVVIGAHGEVLTNAHVVENCTQITVRSSSGDLGASLLVARDEKNDLAVIRTTLPLSSVATFRDGSAVRAGDAVIALGYPLSGLLATAANLSLGNVSALAGLGDDSRYLQISAPVQPGNSGGPLLDASGHLVGIVTAKLNAALVARFTGDIPQNVNFALKAEVVRTFLDSKDIAYKKAHSDQQLSPADVGDIARPFTVQVECEQTGLHARRPPSGDEPTQEDIDWCKDPDNPPDLIIKGCTALTRSSRRDWVAIAYRHRCRAYENKSDFDRALADCTEAIRLNPNYVAFNERGNVYGKKGDFDRALADYNKAIRLDPKSATPFNGRGTVYYQKGDFDRALADYSEAIRLDPKYATPFNGRGNVYSKKGDFDRAIADYSESIRLNPKAIPFIGRGIVYDKKGDFDRAIADYSEAIRLDPSSAIPFIGRGVAYKSKGDVDRAIADYSEAIRLDPKNAMAYSNRGVTYSQKGDVDRAIADYSEAIRLDPKDVHAYFNRGVANLYSGAMSKALADLHEASALDPKDAYVALWLDIIGQRSGVQSRLSEAISTIDMTAWPAPVIRMFLGQMTPSAVLTAADDPNATKKKGQVCEADFYSGEWALSQGSRDEAVRLLRLATDTCPKTFYEWFAAKAELKTLGAAH